MKPKNHNLKLLCLSLLMMLGAGSLYAVDYLCFTAGEANSSVQLKKNGNVTATIQTSTDGTTWTNYTFNTNIPLAVNEKVYFKGNYKGTGTDDYASFVMTGKISASGNLMTLTNGDSPTTTLAGKNYCFYKLFDGCTSLTAAPELPAKTLSNYCYYSMFYGCTGLTQAPALPAKTLSEGCYRDMFHGCTGLTEAPDLPAVTLADYCYRQMFYGCTGLNYLRVKFTSWTGATDATLDWLANVSATGTFVCPTELDTSTRNASRVPSAWTVNVDYLCFTAVEAGSVKLTKKGNITATIQTSTDGTNWTNYTFDTNIPLAVGEKVYFRGNYVGTGPDDYASFRMTGKISASGNIMTLTDGDNPGTSLADKNYCFYKLFDQFDYDLWEGSDVLTTAPDLPATTLANYCYASMFFGSTGLTEAPELPAMTMYDYCYNAMFAFCTGLTETPALPATTVAEHCYEFMFYGCTCLTMAPAQLPAATLASDCYNHMFGSTKLASAPALPATTLAERCYYGMFYDCKNLTAVPAQLPALTLAPNCYEAMFNDCTNLTEAPALPATTLAKVCYRQMFRGCTSLTEVPAQLPATTLVDSCYQQMFFDCQSLTEAPELHATTFAKECCNEMFWGCTQLDYLKVHFTSWADDIDATLNWMGGLWLTGSFVCPEDLDTSIRDDSHVPQDWIVDTGAIVDYLCFTAGEANSSVQLNKHGNIPAGIQISMDGIKWTHYFFDMNIPLAEIGDKVYFRGLYQGMGPDDYASFVMTGKIAASGNIMSLTDGAAPTTSLTGKNYSFYKLFDGCTSLTAAPQLPATTLAPSCYRNVFTGCTGLTAAPALPAINLADYCYMNMFRDCTGLTTAPTLPATNLAPSCYRQMFLGCTGLTAAPVLPATTLFEFCYTNMFNNCTGLTTAPTLPATTMAPNCCRQMFFGCTSLKAAPALSATNLADYCYIYMFYGCTSLTTAPAQLPATNLANYCYTGMFLGCTSLTTAPALPATTLAKGCCYRMFEGCTSLTTAPAQLPATTLAESCYENMFGGCTKLTAAPELPATTLTKYCYFGMFQGCTDLTTAPELPATTLVDSCYYAMFHECTSLNYLKVHFTSWADAIGATSHWVWNVSATGTFVCPTDLDTSIRGAWYVPEGWTVDIISGTNPVLDSRFDPNGVIHNISGQRVDENYKGILIQNGKKYLRRH